MISCVSLCDYFVCMYFIDRSPRVVLTPCQDPVVVVNGLLREEDITVNANEDGLWMDPLAAQTDDNQEGTEINAR